MFYFLGASTIQHLSHGSKNGVHHCSQVLCEGSNCLTHALSRLSFSAGTDTLH